MPKASIAGLEVDTFTKSEFLATVAGRLSRGEKTFVITPYSEFLYAALRDPLVMAMFNRADIAIPDGVAILWAERFLAIPFSVRGYYLKILQVLWQVLYSGAEILLHPKSIYRTFPEKITGADIVWDVAELAAKNNYTVYLLGGFGEIPRKTAEILRRRYPNLNIAGVSNRSPGEEAEILSDLQKAQPDILLVAFGPLKQEKWITDNYTQLPAKLIIGLGGTFDYIAGSKKAPPPFVRKAGLEWLYRLVTQPYRAGRIKNATWDLVWALQRYKIARGSPKNP
jgi:N-acetylglucosaminyldiphosphoundecaprenol N-acetyl-beta-D-mannosaminyltransferase